MSQEYRERIQTQLGGIVGGETHGTVGGGQFSFTEEEMRQIIKNWRDLAYSYNNSIGNARRMVQIRTPAEDVASEAFTGEANGSGRSYLTYLEHNRDYCLEQAQLFQDTLDDYLGVEERAIIALDDAAEGRPRAGL